mmetsp:Transcript_46314/g.77000  ORF Transcript_46314/g.77000 Transcript_46314/m.77000 type:complete len:361 (+) Transcript_46314:75-1157(+)
MATTNTTTNGQGLDQLHTELQAKLKQVKTFKELLPFIEKTLLLESLRVQISAALADALKKEGKDDSDKSGTGIIQSLYAAVTSAASSSSGAITDTAPTAAADADADEDDEAHANMEPRRVDGDQWKRKPPAKAESSLLSAQRNGTTKGASGGDNKKIASANANNDNDDDNENKTATDKDAKTSGASRERRQRRQQRPPSWSTSVCYYCSSTGHFARECPFRRSNNNTRCYHCGKDGHMARDCPQESDASLAEKCFRCGKTGHWARDCDEKAAGPPQSSSGGGGRGSGGRGIGGRGSGGRGKDVCNRCGEKGHWAKDCHLPYQGASKPNDKCNRCGKTGHWAKDCDQPRNDGRGDGGDDDY